MNSIPKSGYYYPNRLALATFNALIDMMGRNGFNAMLNLAHLRNYINSQPPDDLEKGFDFADFSAIQVALEEMYGEEGGRLFIKRAGRLTFSQALKNHGAMVGVSNEAFRCLPLELQVWVGMQALARIMTQISDQRTTVTENASEIIYTVHKCPHCWDRVSRDRCICSFEVGLLEEGLKWITGGRQFAVRETKCIARGDEVCEYSIEKQPINAEYSVKD